jgi:ribosomal protein S14
MDAVAQAGYQHARGSCYRCGQAHDLVDLDAFIEGEGALIICRNCVREAAVTLGINLKDLEKKAQMTEDAQAEVRALKAGLAQHRKDFREYKAKAKA